MTQGTQPVVSVCIPVYNGAGFIAETVRSVLSQTFTEFELLVLDNASTDETPKILEQFDDSRLRVIRHPSNIGATANFNSALSAARGVWVKILCADDLLYPDCLKQQLSRIGESKELVMVCGARDIIDAGGHRWMRRGFPGRSGVWFGTKALCRSVRSGTNLFGEPGAVLVRRETALQAGGFDPAWRFCTDLDLWLRILQYGNLYVEPDVLCAFRVSVQSWSISLVWSQAKEFRRWVCERQKGGLLRASRTDRLTGCAKAYVLMMQRWVFYKLVNRGVK